LVALLYGLLGRNSAQLLEIRLLETLGGAAAGGIVAAFVLPSRSAPRVHQAIVALLRDLAAYARVAAGSAQLSSAGAPREDASELLGAARRLDARFRDLRTGAAPIRNRWLRPGRATSQLLDALAVLVFVVRTSSSTELSPEIRPKLAALSEAIDALADRIERITPIRQTAPTRARPVGRLSWIDSAQQALLDLEAATRTWLIELGINAPPTHPRKQKHPAPTANVASSS
jgi:uncharacterized membrane protein YccC